MSRHYSKHPISYMLIGYRHKTHMNATEETSMWAGGTASQMQKGTNHQKFVMWAAK